MNCERKALIFKALSDSNRLKILEILSCNCGEQCACHILENFKITQPTLSHHMKVLIDAGLVNIRRNGKYQIYSLNKENILNASEFLNILLINKDDCHCGCNTK